MRRLCAESRSVSEDRRLSGRSDERGYFLSFEDGEYLRRVGEIIGLDIAGWLADRERSSYTRRMERSWDDVRKQGAEIDATYAHLRAVIENCKTMDAAAIRHQLVGLLPETRELDPEIAARMREKGLDALADRSAELVKQGWREYGYGEAEDV